MARKRVIDTDELYFDAEIVELLGPKGLHLYIRLWGIAEDWGGYEADYKSIAFRMGAMKLSAKDVQKFIEKLIKAGKIIEFESHGRKIHWIKSFLIHQNLNNPSIPHLPLPPWIKLKVKAYKSGKKYAEFTVVTKKLPVAYQYVTGNSETKQKQKRKRNETETKLNSASGDAVSSQNGEKTKSDPNRLKQPPPSNGEEKTYKTGSRRILKGKKLRWFNEFWDAFDLKSGKAEAADSWIDIEGLDESLAKTIVEAAKRECGARKNLAKGLTPKWPQGWLSKKRWEDEQTEHGMGEQQPKKKSVDQILEERGMAD